MLLATLLPRGFTTAASGYDLPYGLVQLLSTRITCLTRRPGLLLIHANANCASHSVASLAHLRFGTIEKGGRSITDTGTFRHEGS